ncbi:MAG TPA: Amuc_1100 family pilus-like protein [Verrucomicrobiae bacterium]|nr:Amuc_1100 family pilus-like protein [Verrucomicrobiae bacterium]
MNLSWLKKHVMIVSFVAAFLIVLGVVVWLQQQASGKKAEIDAALQEQMSQLNHLLQTKPAPSPANIDIVKQDRAQVDHLYQELLANVAHSRVHAPPDLRPVAFLQMMASQLAKLGQAADGAGVKIVDGFAFGFSRYAGTPPTIPARNLSEEDTKRVVTLLVKQLRAIEKISTLLIESHVDDLNQIRRSEVEPSNGPDTLDAPIVNDPKALYQTLPFEFQFHCTPEALRDFLNSLTRSDWFFAVRRVQITGEPPPPTEKPAAGSHGGAPAPTAVSPPKRAHLAVTVRVDLIEFSGKPTGKAETGKPDA